MKRSFRLIVIVGVVVLLAVALILIQNGEETDGTQTADTGPDLSERVPILTVERESVERIEVANEFGTIIVLPELIAENEVAFRPEYAYDVQFSDQSVNQLVRSATTLTSRRIIGEVSDLEPYGLTDPRATVTTTTESGVERVYVGAMTPARDGYYVRIEGDPQVYTVFSTWIDPLLQSLGSLRLRTMPQIAAETIESVTVDPLDGREIRVRRRLETETDPELGATLLTVAPYQRPFQTSNNWLTEDVVPLLESMRIEEYVEDQPQELAQYGLAPPEAEFEIIGTEESVSLLVGTPTDGGRYAMFENGQSVFVVSGVEPLVSTRPFETISPFALILNIDLVDRVVVNDFERGREYNFEIERVAVAGEEEPAETFYLNGSAIDDEVAKDIYQRFIGLRADDDDVSLATGQPVISVTYHFVDRSMSPRTVRFIPDRSRNFLGIVRDGPAEFRIARDQIDLLLRDLRELSRQ